MRDCILSTKTCAVVVIIVTLVEPLIQSKLKLLQAVDAIYSVYCCSTNGNMGVLALICGWEAAFLGPRLAIQSLKKMDTPFQTLSCLI